MLYFNTEWNDYYKDNDMINLYVNLRNIARYINNTTDTLNIVQPKHSIFNKKKVQCSYIDISNTFNIDKVSYYYRKIIDRFNSIDKLSDFFKAVSDFADFLLFIKKIENIGLDYWNIEQSSNKIKISHSNSEITIEQTAIENNNRSGSVILDLLDNKDNANKYITFYIMKIGNNFNGRFITDEEPKFTMEEQIVISNFTDNFILCMKNTINNVIMHIFHMDKYDYINTYIKNLCEGKIIIDLITEEEEILLSGWLDNGY